MKVKLFEIRDEGTFIPVAAMKCEPSKVLGVEHEGERYLLRRSGYGQEWDSVILCRLECSGVDRNATYDPFAWGYGRTMQVAHEYIRKNFETLESGQVIDVEHILGERETPKISERIEMGVSL